MLCKLLKLQSAPDVDIECFSGKMLEYHYFYALFREVIESKIEKPKGKLIRFIKGTADDAREPINIAISRHTTNKPHWVRIKLRQVSLNSVGFGEKCLISNHLGL